MKLESKYLTIDLSINVEGIILLALVFVVGAAFGAVCV
jgi:hypothetical protein